MENLTNGDAPFTLDCTVRLTDGSLVFAGAEQFANLATTTRFPVVGGTGTYAGASGAVTSTPARLTIARG